jgi:hypothetical protein
VRFFIIYLIITGIIGWVIKIRLKRRMERGLGREVQDRDLTSINTWMEALPDEKESTQGQR